MNIVPWTPTDLHRANAFFTSGLDPDNAHWEDDARNAFLLMRRHGLGVEALAVTKHGVPAEDDVAHGGPHPGRRGGDDPPLDPEKVEIPFGKYRGDSFAAISRHDPGYIRWVDENFPFRDEAMAEMVKNLRTSLDATVNSG